jgi:hypothetical protein
MSRNTAGRAACAALLFVFTTAAALGQVPSSQHVILVINENTSFGQVMANMPWLVGQGRMNGYAINYKSDSAGSLMDYLWLASGSCHSSANCALPAGTHDFHCTGTGCYYPYSASTDPITDDNIFRELNNARVSWKVYAESYAAAGGTVTAPDNNNDTPYYRRHNAATWYSDIVNDVDGSADKIVDLSELSTDLESGKLPRFAIIIPDGNHDAHDCPVGVSTCTETQKLAAADLFLKNTLDPILGTPDFKSGGNGLLIITFDECGSGTDEGCGAAVYTALIGPRVTPHKVSTAPYKHENTLRTVLDSLGIKTYPGASAKAADMVDFFRTNGSKPKVVLSSPLGGESLGSPVKIQASASPAAGHAISGWSVYVDSTERYSAGAVSAISPTIGMSAGSHALVVRAWDTSGAFGDHTLSLMVRSLHPTVSVSTPRNYANVGSPIKLHASGSPTAGQAISGWRVYVDTFEAFEGGPASVINPRLTMGLGTHKVLVRAWDTSGAYGDQTLTLTVSGKPAVAVSTPVADSNIISPINIKASATPSGEHSISGWLVYVDRVAKYRGGSVESINANVAASAGAHTVIVRAWDSSGAYGDRTVSVNVKPVAVNIKTPANGASVRSSVNVVADALSANPIKGWHIYVDSIPSFAQEDGNQIDAILALGTGTHTLVVRSWDSKGVYGDQTIHVTVP